MAGQANTYDMTRADQPQQEGMELNKANLLTDAVAAAFGLNDTAVPNDILNILKKAALYTGVREKYTRHETLADYPLGKTIRVEEDGALAEFYVAEHDYEPELNGSGRTLLVRKNCLSNTRAWHTYNINAYATSDIDSFLNVNYKNTLGTDVQTSIATTKFRYTPGNGNDSVETLERAVFLLSVTELGKTTSMANTEGSALPIAELLQIAKINSTAYSQATRSPQVGVTNAINYLSDAGVTGISYCTASEHIRPAFTYPSEYPLVWYSDDEGNVYTEQEYEAYLTDVLGNKINAGVQAVSGSYVGTGTFGADNPCTLSFGFTPKLVVIMGGNGDSGRQYFCIFVNPHTAAGGLMFRNPGYVSIAQKVTWSGDSMSWYILSADTTAGSYDITKSAQIYQLNYEGWVYNYVAIG